MTNCAQDFLGVQGASAACYDCLVINIASEQTYGSTVTTCTTDTTPPLGFNGNENSLILSKYPLANTDVR